MMLDRLRKARAQIIPCSPPSWAFSGHLQTLLGHFLPSPQGDQEGEGLNIPLGNEKESIHTTYYKGEVPIVVYLFHGLGGSADASYMQRTAIIVRRLGYHLFINNHRGCGKGVGLAARPYHSGRAEDLSAVVAYGKSKLPECQHIAIGFSLSANALLLLAAGIRGQVLPDMAIAVNGPINLNQTSLDLSRNFNRIYNFRFILQLRRYVKDNYPKGTALLKGVWDLRTFDEVYTAPMGGFKSREDYYQACSAQQYLSQIKIPTVLLTAEDDPFVDVRDYFASTLSPSVILHVEKHGGHMGYLSMGKLRRWLDYALENYLKSIQN